LEPELFQALERRAKEEKRSMSNLCNLLLRARDEKLGSTTIQKLRPKPKLNCPNQSNRSQN
jgi:hypothetical protein